MTSKDEKAMKFIRGSTIGVAIFGLLSILVLGLLYLNGVMELKKQEEDFQNRVSGFTNPFFAVENKIEAKSAVVIDDQTGIVLYAKHENKELPIASLTKIMSTLVAGQYLEQNNIKTTTIGNVEISSQADLNFLSGEEWAVDDLLTAMLVSSSNVAAESLFNEVTKSQVNIGGEGEPITLVAMMNEIARSFGLRNTRYLNSTGLDIEDMSVMGGNSFGGVSTAFEVVATTRFLEAVFPDLASKTTLKEVELFSKDGIPHKFFNTDPLIEKIPIYFSKTGFTDNAGGCLVVRTKVDDRFIYIVVLGSTKDGRFTDIEKLYNGSVVLFEDLQNRGVALEELREHDLIGYGY
jgi:serine-type D-Ala-D-Ala carboxypeptidase (penicillin-binding protein 5/6)